MPPEVPRAAGTEDKGGGEDEERGDDRAAASVGGPRWCRTGCSGTVHGLCAQPPSTSKLPAFIPQDLHGPQRPAWRCSALRS